MAQKSESIFAIKDISLNKFHDGYWLYDKTRGMNLSMKAATERDACVETIEYYQRRLLQVEGELKSLRIKVDSFLEQFDESGA